jgi:hypothetical protein
MEMVVNFIKYSMGVFSPGCREGGIWITTLHNRSSLSLRDRGARESFTGYGSVSGPSGRGRSSEEVGADDEVSDIGREDK